MQDPLPKISVITVVFNGRDLLKGTMDSVFEQTYPNIEYVVVDGASTDGTTDLIRQHQHQIDRWISEPDRGLYDAMNKGLKMATGDFVWFMNAGDRIFDPKTVEKIVARIRPDTDVLFGEVMLVDDDRRHIGTRSQITTQKLPETLTWKSLRRGMVVCHQGFVARRQIAPFFIEKNLSADIDWVIKCLKNARRVTHTHLLIAEYLMGGLSKKKH
ncbi:MAG: glycosyltransferase, partial [Bacteroidetes bacterium]